MTQRHAPTNLNELFMTEDWHLVRSVTLCEQDFADLERLQLMLERSALIGELEEICLYLPPDLDTATLEGLDHAAISALIGRSEATNIEGDTPQTLAALCTWGWFKEAIDLTLYPVDAQVVDAFIAAGPYPALESLCMSDEVGGEEVARLVEAPELMPSLWALDLTNNHIGPRGAQALALTSSLSALEDLVLSNTAPGAVGLHALLTSERLTSLQRLVLSYNPAASDAWREALAALALPALTTLDLHAGIQAAEDYLTENHLPLDRAAQLLWLDVSNLMTEEAGRALTELEHFSKLELLRVTSNEPTKDAHEIELKKPS